MLPSCFHAGPGHRIEGRNPWRLQPFPPSAPRGDPFFGVSFVRFRYGPSGCSPPGLITTLGTHCLRGRPEALHPGFQPPGHPTRLPDVTTAPNRELRRQDSHLLVQQLASLRSLRGVRWGAFPRFVGSMGCSDVRVPFSVRFDSRADTAVRPGFARRRGGTHPRQRLAVRRGATPLVPRRHPDLPGSWRTLLRACPALGPRRGGGRQAVTASPCCLPPLAQRRPSRRNVSGLYHAACTVPVYASQGGSLRHHATRGSGWWPALAGRVWLPAGSCRKVSE